MKNQITQPIKFVSYMAPLPGERFRVRERVASKGHLDARWPVFLYDLNPAGSSPENGESGTSNTEKGSECEVKEEGGESEVKETASEAQEKVPDIPTATVTASENNESIAQPTLNDGASLEPPPSTS